MKLACLVVAVLALAVPARAEAKCGTPLWLGTPSGATIPARGSLYLYDEHLELRDKPRAGGPIVRETKVSDHVVRLDYASQADELGMETDGPLVFTIDRGWRPPAAAPRVLQYWHHASAWTRSSSDSLMLQIDQPTAAVRVRWKPTGGVAREWLLPARTDERNVNVLELGTINCGSTTLEPAELVAGGELSLIAIRFDGSEVAVAGVPPLLKTSMMPTTSEGVERALKYEPGTEPIAPAVIPYEDGDFSFYLFLVVLAVFGGLLMVRFGHRSLKIGASPN